MRFAAAETGGAVALILPREQDHEYDVDHRGDGVLHPHQRPRPRNFRLVTAPGRGPRRGELERAVPHRADVMLEEVDVLPRTSWSLVERDDGLLRLRVTDIRRRRRAPHIEFAEPVYTARPSINPEFATPRSSGFATSRWSRRPRCTTTT